MLNLSVKSVLIICTIILTACSSQNVKKTSIDKIIYKPKDLAAMEKVKRSKTNFIKDLFLGIGKKDSENREYNLSKNNSYNKFLWKASIDILSSFSSLSDVNEMSGIISTEWRISKKSPNKRYKITALLNSDELDPNSITIRLYKQGLSEGKWITMPVKESSLQAVKNKIYKRAIDYNKDN